MTNDSSNDNFSGYRFLLDAKGGRQYALEFDNGAPKLPLHIYNGADIMEGETVFALDDNYTINKQGRDITVTTDAYQITGDYVDENGDMHYSVEAATITYDVVPQSNGRMKLQLTPSSRQALADSHFDVSFPQSFNDADIPVPGTARKLQLALPPQHKGNASVARAALGQPVTEPVQTISKVREQFNDTNARNYKVRDNDIEQVLAQYCKDLSEEARQGRLDPVVGRDEETDQAMKVIIRRKQSSLCFTGEAGVGKSAMFAAIAQRLADEEATGNLPQSLEGARVIELDLQSMNAGAKYRGQFEERLKPLIDGLAERGGYLKGKKIILAIDEIHSQLTAGKAEGGANAGNMMKPFLTAKGVSVLGTTTDKEYRKYIEKDPALASRFEKVRLNPPNDEGTFTILKRLWPLTEECNGLTEEISDENLKYIVTMTNRYAPSESQPRKSEKAMNTAAASAEFDGRESVSREDIIAAVSQMSGLSKEFLAQSDAERFLKLEKELPEKVLGQPDIERITDGLIGARGGLTNPRQPWGCFVLQGPTGTGKTETAKALARYLFGSEDAVITLNMSEYAEKHAVARLLGAPPGYVGFEDSEPVFEQVRQRPYSIILLDEIEKAHPDVFNILLPILEDGRTKDNHGNTILFNNTIILMTSNAGAEDVTNLIKNGGKTGISLGGNNKLTAEEMKAAEEKIYEKARQKANGGPFRPEMINRIEMLGGFVTYLPLEKDVVAKIARKQIDTISERLSGADGQNLGTLKLDVAPDVMDKICELGYDRTMGARPLQKVIREKVVNPLTKWLMENRAAVEVLSKKGGAKITINSIDLNDQRRFSVQPTVEKLAGAATNDNKKTPAAPVKKTAASNRPEI